jgi:sn-glycerol 3-phosphate transport system substrate-binding protein
MKFNIYGTALAAALTMASTAAYAEVEVQWWHAMGGTNGERVNKIAGDFNASQSEYKVVPTYKGNYTETMTAAVAAFRADEQPQIVQVFEVGTATMMAAKGAIYPVEQLMKDAGEPFDKSDFLPAVSLIIKPQKASFCRCLSTVRHLCFGTTKTHWMQLVLTCRQPGTM